MQVQGVLGSVELDGATVIVRKKQVGGSPTERRIAIGKITAITYKPATRLWHGYVQLLVAGSEAADEATGVLFGGRPPQDDMNSLSIRRKANDQTAKLVAAIEATRDQLSR